MKIRTKILITLVLAFLTSWLIQRFQDPSPQEPSEASYSDLNEHLIYQFGVYNNAYFQDKLPTDVVIDFSETRDLYVSVTDRLPDGRYRIAFNKRYVRAMSVADVILLHEACHIPTYDYKDPVDGYHGKEWRACMTNLEIQGAFHYALIDSFRGGR